MKHRMLLVLIVVVVAAAGPASGQGGPQSGSAGRADPRADQTYTMRLIAWGTWATGCGILDGPAGQAESVDATKGHDVDDAGNAYWTHCDVPVIRSYRRASGQVVTLAGSTFGQADGPLHRARFGGWTYNSTNLLSVSGDGQHIFLADAIGGGVWRHVDLKAGRVKTIGPMRDKGAYLIIAKDKSGQIRAFRTDGGDPPDCPGYTKLNCAAAKMNWTPFDRYALDAETGRFYYHCRGNIYSYDLKAGAIADLNAGGTKRRASTSGPFESWSPYCPTGMSISPAGRYLYVGGGDDQFVWQMDLQTRQMLMLGWDAKRASLKFRESGADYQTPIATSMHWPAACAFTPDGKSAAWTGGLGIIMLEAEK